MLNELLVLSQSGGAFAFINQHDSIMLMKTVWILISWLHQKLADQDLHRFIIEVMNFEKSDVHSSMLIRLNMGLGARKPIFGGSQTTKAQTSLRIRAV